MKKKMQAGGLLPQSNKKAGPVDGNKDYGTLQRNTFGKYITSQTKAKNGIKMTKAKNGKSFPDLNKDGKITQADILKGRGVIAKKGAKVTKAKPTMKKMMGGGKCRSGC
jgi:hypothetical protein